MQRSMDLKKILFITKKKRYVKKEFSMTTREMREEKQRLRRIGKCCKIIYSSTYNLEKTYTGKLLYEKLESLENTAITYSKKEEIKREYNQMLFEENSQIAAIVAMDYTLMYLMQDEYNITVYDSQNVYWGKGERFFSEEEMNNLQVEEFKRECEEMQKIVEKNRNKKEHWYDKEYRTAPTLADGFFIYIICMIFISIFNERIPGWIVATMLFIWWAKMEINKYNK